MPNDVTIDVVVNADQAVATMEQVGQETAKVGQATEASSRQWKMAGTSLGRFGQAMTNILVLTNLLPGSMGRAVNTTLLLATTTINAVYAVSQLVSIYRELAKVQRVQIALQSILAALSGVGIGKVALAAGVGVTAYAATTALMNREGGGEDPAPITVVNNGVMMGNESEARLLARKIQQLNREDMRLGR